MKKKFYQPPICSLTFVVLEQGLCADSGNAATISAKGNVEVKDYQSVGDPDNDYFNDIEFN